MTALPFLSPKPVNQQKKTIAHAVSKKAFFLLAVFFLSLLTGITLLKGKKNTYTPDIIPTTFPSPPSIVTDTPIPFSPSTTIIPTIYALPIVWTPYRDGTHIYPYDFYFTYPYNWRINYRKMSGSISPPENFLVNIEFDFLPSGITPNPEAKDWLGWGGMTVTIYQQANTVQEWVGKTFSDQASKLIAYSDSTIGNKPAYLILPRKDLPSNDPLNNGFIPRHVVLGKMNVYEFGFFQNGTQNFKDVIQRAIWPFFHFN